MKIPQKAYSFGVLILLGLSFANDAYAAQIIANLAKAKASASLANFATIANAAPSVRSLPALYNTYLTNTYGMSIDDIKGGMPGLLTNVQAVNTAWGAYKTRNSTKTQEDLRNAVDQIGFGNPLLKNLFGAQIITDYTTALGAINTLNTTTRAANNEVMDAKNYLLGLIGRRGNMALVTPLDQKMEAIFATQLRTVVPAATVDPIKQFIKERPGAALPTTALVTPVPPAVGASYLDTYNEAQPVASRMINTITASAGYLNVPAVQTLTGAVAADNLQTQVQKAVAAINNTEAALVANAGAFALPAGTLDARANALLRDFTARVAGGGAHGTTLTAIDTYLANLPNTPTSFAVNVTTGPITGQITTLLGAGGLAIGQQGIRDILVSPTLGLAAAAGTVGTTDTKVQAVVEALVMELWKTFHELTKANGYPGTAANTGISAIAQQQITRLNTELANARLLAGGGTVTTATDAQIIALKNTLIADLGGKLNDCTAGNLNVGAGVNVGNLITVINEMKDALAALSVGVTGLPAGNGAALANAIRTHITGTVAPTIPPALYTMANDPTLATINNGTALGNLAALNINGTGIINVTDLTLVPGYTPAQFETAAKKAFASLWLLVDAIDAANERFFGKNIQQEIQAGAANGAPINCTVKDLTEKSLDVIAALERQIATLNVQIAAKDAQITTLTAAAAGGGAASAIATHNAEVDRVAAQIAAFWPGFGGTPLSNTPIDLISLQNSGELQVSATIPPNIDPFLKNYFSMTTNFPTALGLSVFRDNGQKVSSSLKKGVIRNMILDKMPWANIFALKAAATAFAAGSGAKTFDITPATLTPAPTVVPNNFSLAITTL